jgi:hypothetical protein
LEAIAFSAKDALLTVDDFAPHGNAAEVSRYHGKAERLFRAQGNNSGRQRCRPDGSVLPAKPPRGFILSTGEDLPRGQSLQARLLAIGVTKGDIDRDKLTKAQKAAAAGLYTQALVGYIRWLAPNYSTIQSNIPKRLVELRDQAQSGEQHARTPSIVADLALGLEYFLTFAVSCGAISEQQRSKLWEQGWSALCEAGSMQAEYVNDADPAEQFLRLLAAAISSKRAHVAGTNGQEPVRNAIAWGWHSEETTTGTIWRDHGRRVGWVDGDNLYLQPEAAYASAQEMAVSQGESLTVSPRVLWKRLRESNMLVTWEDGRERNTARKMAEGKQRTVLHLRAGTLFAEPTAVSDPGKGIRTENRPIRTVGKVKPSYEKPRKSSEKNAVSSEIGRLGRFSREGKRYARREHEEDGKAHTNGTPPNTYLSP